MSILDLISENPVAFASAVFAGLSAITAVVAWWYSRKDAKEAKASAYRSANALEGIHSEEKRLNDLHTDANRIYKSMDAHLKGNAAATRIISETGIRQHQMEIYQGILLLQYIVANTKAEELNKSLSVRLSINMPTTEYFKILASLKIFNYYFDVTKIDDPNLVAAQEIFSLLELALLEYNNDKTLINHAIFKGNDAITARKLDAKIYLLMLCMESHISFISPYTALT